VVGAVQVQALIQIVDQPRAVLGQERQDGIQPLLQVALRIDQPRKISGVEGHAGIAGHGFAADLALHLGELVEHLLAVLAEGGGQAGVETGQVAGQTVDGLLHGRFGLRQGAGEGRRNQARGDAVAHGILAMRAIGQGQSVARHQLAAALIEQRETGAVQRGGHAAQNGAVDDCGLRQIRQLGRTADVGHGRQHGILHHGTQQRVGRKLGGAVHQFFGREAAAILQIVAAIAAQRVAAAVLQQEDEGSLVLHVDLRVIAGGFQRAIALQQRGGQIRRGGQRGTNRGRGQFAHGGRHGIDMQQPVLRQQALEQRAERLAHGAAGLIGFFHQRGNLVAERQAGQRRAQFRDGRRSQDKLPDGLAGCGRVGLLQLDGMVLGVEHPAVIDFGEVVVFGGQPEDGHGGDAPRR
jgi:hypothetical protein